MSREYRNTQSRRFAHSICRNRWNHCVLQQIHPCGRTEITGRYIVTMFAFLLRLNILKQENGNCIGSHKAKI